MALYHIHFIVREDVLPVELRYQGIKLTFSGDLVEAERTDDLVGLLVDGRDEDEGYGFVYEFNLLVFILDIGLHSRSRQVLQSSFCVIAFKEVISCVDGFYPCMMLHRQVNSR